MTFLAPAIPALIGAAGSAAGGLLGGAGKSSPQINYTPTGFDAGGLSAKFTGNGYEVGASADRNNTVGQISNTFGQQAGDIAGLRGQFAPGFSAMRAAQLSALNNNRSQALGDLRQNLAQRRVLGSSFAQNSIANADQAYQDQISQTMAQSYLQELQVNQSLIQQQYQASVSSFQTKLNEMNLEAGIASDLTSKASSSMAQLANAQAQLDAKSAAGSGQFFGGLGSMFGSALGKANFGSLFGGGGTTSAVTSALSDPAIMGAAFA